MPSTFEFMYQLGVIAIPNFDNKVVLGSDNEAVVTVPCHHGDCRLFANVEKWGRVVQIGLGQRHRGVDVLGLPLQVLVLPDFGGAVFAAAQESGRPVGVLDAVDKVGVGLELAHFDWVAEAGLVVDVEEVDADDVVVAAGSQKGTTGAEWDAEHLSARTRFFDELLWFWTKIESKRTVEKLDILHFRRLKTLI